MRRFSGSMRTWYASLISLKRSAASFALLRSGCHSMASPRNARRMSSSRRVPRHTQEIVVVLLRCHRPCGFLSSTFGAGGRTPVYCTTQPGLQTPATPLTAPWIPLWSQRRGLLHQRPRLGRFLRGLGLAAVARRLRGDAPVADGHQRRTKQPAAHRVASLHDVHHNGRRRHRPRSRPGAGSGRRCPGCTSIASRPRATSIASSFLYTSHTPSIHVSAKRLGGTLAKARSRSSQHGERLLHQRGGGPLRHLLLVTLHLPTKVCRSAWARCQLAM